jgi:cellulose synthase/poly-beta-1,6-N-acetylglucosamine synthase-like glycosyltransferase
MSTDNALVTALQWLFLGYFALMNLVYVALDLIALRVIGRDAAARALAALPQYSTGLEPAISLLVPAYNEAATIAASVHSMLQLDYPEFEIIVVNDGSRDDTLQVLQREFGLVPFPQAYRIAVPVKEVQGVYRSPRHHNLLVIDKANGGKADALNAGLNAARHPLFCAVDADSILQRDSLQRVVRPFLQDAQVIAAGGTIRIANGCRISHGFLERIGMPRNLLARIQIVEYLRAFLFGRLGWSPLNAMLIISGAFGVFRRDTVIEVGGYRHDTIGEDMELVVRLHAHHRLRRKPYRIVYVADPICWTEAPENLKVLRNQRVRWQRGLMESLWAHRRLLFHPRSGAVGWIAYPAMLLIEGLGPAIELLGYVLMAAAFASGLISWQAFGAFMLLALGLGLMLSASALLLEEMSFHLYPSWRHLGALIGAMLLENLGYRQLTAWWRLRGLALWLARRKAKWGEMRRRGLGRPSQQSRPAGREEPR